MRILDHSREHYLVAMEFRLLALVSAKPQMNRIMIFDTLQREEPETDFKSVSRAIDYLLAEGFFVECRAVNHPEGLMFGIKAFDTSQIPLRSCVERLKRNHSENHLRFKTYISDDRPEDLRGILVSYCEDNTWIEGR